MSNAELQQGLSYLSQVAGDFSIGDWNPERMAVPLLHGSKIRAWVSEEILSDLPASPELKPALSRGIEATRQEIQSGGSRVVLITTTGPRFEA